MPSDLRDFTRAELEEIFCRLGGKKIHAARVFTGLYREGLCAVSALDIPENIKRPLAEHYTIAPAPSVEKLVSKIDGTVKLLFHFSDGALAESVVLFNKGRASACLSSQSGCACGCVFCATGALGLRRSLSPHEIAEQFFAAASAAGGKLDSLVFMGMGEPFLNWQSVRRAILILSDGKGCNFPQSKMTVSTVGVIPVINELASSDLKIRLAVSLITADEVQRAELVPMNAKYPLPDVIEAARAYCAATKRQVFFEYILFGGLNDSPAHAAKLAALVRGMDCKINLIPFNPSPKSRFAGVPPDAAKAFQKLLVAAGLRTYLRREKGSDIAAACGQLAAKHSAS